MHPGTMRREFAAGMLVGLRVLWPVLSVLLSAMAALGLVIGRLEGWSAQESIYFAFVSGLTIGYGDFSPTTGLARLLAILVGMFGVLFTALVAAVAVKALTATRKLDDGAK
jgi:Ion channel